MSDGFSFIHCCNYEFEQKNCGCALSFRLRLVNLHIGEKEHGWMLSGTSCPDSFRMAMMICRACLKSLGVARMMDEEHMAGSSGGLSLSPHPLRDGSKINFL